jgi:Caudovirus prohead serine protease
MPIEHKTFAAEVKAFDDANLIVENFISTEHKDRGGDIMRAKGMKIVGKPVVLMLHGRGPMGSEPVAKPLSITVDEFKGQPGILAKTQFFPDETGQRLYQKIKGGFMPNWSIGYMVDESKDLMRDGNYDGRDVTKWQLLEYSPVGVPMNPFAQTIKEFLDKTEKGEEIKAEEARWFGFIDPKECKECGQGCVDKGAIPYKKTPVAAAGAAWDGPSQVAKADVATLKKICVWYDASKPDLKNSYKGPHHMADGDHKLVPAAVKALAGVMMGARGGMNIPDSDRAGVMSHVAKHYADCGLGDPPWKKDDGSDEIPPGTLPEEKQDEQTDRIAALDAELVKQREALILAGEAIVSAGKRFDDYDAAIASMKTVTDTLTESIKKLEPLLTSLPPAPEDGDKGKESPPENPPEPEKKAPPRLVVVRDEDTRQAKTRAAILAVAKEALGEVVKQEIDRMRGRVP